MSEREKIAEALRVLARRMAVLDPTVHSMQNITLCREAAALLAAQPEDVWEAPLPEPRELLCQLCGRDYEVWFAPNELWNSVMRLPDGSDRYPFVCPTCFMTEAAGDATNVIFRVDLDVSQPEDVGELRLTALAAYIVLTAEATNLGYAPTVPDDVRAWAELRVAAHDGSPVDLFDFIRTLTRRPKEA